MSELLYTARVRVVIPTLEEPFRKRDVLQALGISGAAAESGTRLALEDLVAGGELEKATASSRARHCVYRRTISFRASPVDPHATVEAALFLQRLAIAWGTERAERARERNAAAD